MHEHFTSDEFRHAVKRQRCRVLKEVRSCGLSPNTLLVPTTFAMISDAGTVSEASLGTEL